MSDSDPILEAPPTLFEVLLAKFARAMFVAGAFWLVIGGLGVCFIANQSRPGMNPIFRTDPADMPPFLTFAFEAFVVTAVLLWVLELIWSAVVWTVREARRDRPS
jgi:hypothetical protein